MVSIKLKLKAKTNAEGEHSIVLQVLKDRQKKIIATGLLVKKERCSLYYFIKLTVLGLHAPSIHGCVGPYILKQTKKFFKQAGLYPNTFFFQAVRIKVNNRLLVFMI